MGITKDRGRYYWVMGVPKRYQGFVLGKNGQPVKQVRQALRTSDRREAMIKAAQIEAERLAEWEALFLGNAKDARLHYEAAKRLAEARGFPYRKLEELAAQDPVALARRIMSLAGQGAYSPEVTGAVLGTVPEALPTLLDVRDDFYNFKRADNASKSEGQLKRWKLPRDRAVSNFLKAVSETDGLGNRILKPIDAYTRDDALTFRDWWSARIETDGMDPETANKDFGHLSSMIRTWSELKGADVPNIFAKVRFSVRKNKNRTVHPPFSRAWITERLLIPGALDGLNDEARDVFLMTINTGLRPSEITDAPPADFILDGAVPFLRVAPNGRELKVAHTERDVPLLGVSLDAARRIAARGGVQRYAQKAGGWSATVNKYLRERGLMETPEHVAYSVRHYVEDALLAASVDDRVRADVLGHLYKRPSYGTGGALEGRRAALTLIAL